MYMKSCPNFSNGAYRRGQLKRLRGNFAGCHDLGGLHLRGHFQLYQQLYKDEMRIRSEALDYECLTKAISLLPKLSKVVYLDLRMLGSREE